MVFLNSMTFHDLNSMTFHGSMLCPSQEHSYFHRRDAPLKPEDKAAHTTIIVLMTYLCRMVTPFCPVRNIIILTALTLLVG